MLEYIPGLPTLARLRGCADRRFGASSFADDEHRGISGVAVGASAVGCCGAVVRSSTASTSSGSPRRDGQAGSMLFGASALDVDVVDAERGERRDSQRGHGAGFRSSRSGPRRRPGRRMSLRLAPLMAQPIGTPWRRTTDHFQQSVGLGPVPSLADPWIAARSRPTMRSKAAEASLIAHRTLRPRVHSSRRARSVWVPETRPWSLTCRDAGRC